VYQQDSQLRQQEEVLRTGFTHLSFNISRFTANELDGSLSAGRIKVFIHREVPEEILFFFGDFLWRDSHSHTGKVYVVQKNYIFTAKIRKE
jgi:hypothetical protein